MRAVERKRFTEDDLVAAVREVLTGAPGARPFPRLRVDIGDDAAVWKSWSSHLSLVTTDMLIDGVHFRMRATTPRELGHKALAQSLSDVAAMAGAPTVVVVALGITDEIDEPWVREFYAGMSALATRSRCAVAGGDIVRAPALVIGVTVTGEVRRTRMRLRSGARAGDVAAVTGPLGRAAAGLGVLDKDLRAKLSAAAAEAVCRAYLTPEPRLREGEYLGSRRGCHALMDISDGLSTDLQRMSLASQLDASVQRLLIAPDAALEAAASALNTDPFELMVNGGDDYELLAAIDPRAFRHIARGFRARFGRPLQQIGSFSAGTGRLWLEDDKKRTELPPAGWDHFRR